MSLKNVNLENQVAYLIILECDICGVRFSQSMEWAWPFCSSGIPHPLMTSKTQIEFQNKLSKCPEKATATYVLPMLKLYGPQKLSHSFSDERLPDYPERDEVTLRRSTLKEFLDRYKMLCEFVGNVLGKHRFNLLDVVDYSMKAWPQEGQPVGNETDTQPS